MSSSMASETNLKVRQPLPETAGFGKDPDKLSTFKGESWLFFFNKQGRSHCLRLTWFLETFLSFFSVLNT